MPSKKKLYRKLKRLNKRMDSLENPCKEKPRKKVSTGSTQHQYCSMPKVTEREFAHSVSESRERLIRPIMKKWVNGTTLRYYFFNSGLYAGAGAQKDIVRQGFEVWRVAGIGIPFQETTNIEEAEIRIGFLQGDGAWSYVGRDVIDIPRQYERTMNFGWDLTQDRRGVDTPVHEIGHTLGFKHEHQNPIAGIVWDEEAVYDYFGGPPNNWSRATTYRNVLQQNPPSSVEGSAWDPNSIMHYGFDSGLIIEPDQYRNGISPELGLSATDRAEALRLYPSIEDETNENLNRFELKRLNLKPAQQVNYNITPSATNNYTIQTFGGSDTVMVLFENVDGEMRKVSADDDSGEDRNAFLSVRLQQGRDYVLRIRLYSDYASGGTAVMMW